MKRIITLMLTVAMCISLCACGGKVSKEEMLKNAQEIDIIDLLEDYGENSVRAKETHVGKTYTVTGYIFDIKDDYVILTESRGYSSNFGLSSLHVYLSKDELTSLNANNRITVVGKIDEIDIDNVKGTSLPYYKMNNAYCVYNEYEITGEVISIEKNNTGDTYYWINDENGDGYNVYFKNGAINNIGKGDNIVVSGQIKLESSSAIPKIDNAILISKN